jgi:acyl-CoA thioesterase
MWTIHDDIRSAGVVRAILGDRKIQSASMLFATPTKAMLFQAPYEIPRQKTSPEALKQRAGFVIHALMNAMFTTTAELMEPAGTLTMGWFAQAEQNHPEYLPQRDFSGLRFWDQYTARMPPVILKNPGAFSGMTAVIAQYVRNKTPWDGDGKGQ